MPRDILASYQVICGAIIHGLKALGVDAEFKPINDIAAGGKKISGNAQTRRHGVVLQHGTVLVDSDIPTMFRVLRVSDAKISDKMIKAVEERVTNVRRYLGREVPFREARDALVSGFEAVFDVRLRPGRLTRGEERTMEELKAKYTSREWVYQR
jgi:lipoate-protein ligase A